jgi:hypothetical protein
MKFLLTASALILVVYSHAQLLTRPQVVTALNVARDSANAQTSRIRNLVSEYTFRKLVRNDFSVLLTGEENKTKVGRYASLEVDKDEKTFSVTPIAFVPGNSPLRSPFHWITTIDLSGSVSGKGIFDWEERKKVKAGFSVAWVNALYRFFPGPVPNRKYKPNVNVYTRLHDNLYNQFVTSYDNFAGNLSDSISNSGNYTDPEKLQEAYLDKLNDMELKLTEDVWNLKIFYWFKLNVTPVSYDVLSLVSKADTASFNSPISKNMYNPSAQFSANGYLAFRRYGSFYGSAWMRFGQKHTLSEIGSTQEWSKVSPLGDSSSVQNDTRDVYVVNDAGLKTKVLPDIGVEFIYLLPEKEWLHGFTPGINFSWSTLGILSPINESGRGKIQTISIGLIIPLKDKEGKSKVNIVPFYEQKKFVDFNKARKDFFGVKFSLPFNNLLE